MQARVLFVFQCTVRHAQFAKASSTTSSRVMTVKPAIINAPLLSRPPQESNRRKGPAALGLQHREEPRDLFLFASPLSVLSQPLAVLCALPLIEAACVGVLVCVWPVGLSSIVLQASEHLNSPACKGDTMTMTAPKPVKLKLEETNTFLQVAPLPLREDNGTDHKKHRGRQGHP